MNDILKQLPSNRGKERLPMSGGVDEQRHNSKFNQESRRRPITSNLIIVDLFIQQLNLSVNRRLVIELLSGFNRFHICLIIQVPVYTLN